MRLVYEDPDVIVVDKPTGLVTAPMPGTPEHDNPELREQSVFGVVKRFIKDKRRVRGTRVWIIHRLDKEASGLLVFAGSDRAYEQLKEEFRTKRAHRLYTAVAEGEFKNEAPALPGRTPQAASGIIRSMLAEGADGLMRSVRQDRRSADDPGQNAVTHWRVVAAGAGRTLLQLRLDTGRKNQIRVHMREAGHPLVGDRRYGGKSNPISRLCLHATELGFTHPATGQDVRFFSPPPQAFYGLVNQVPPLNTLAGSKPSAVGEALRAPPASKTAASGKPAPGQPETSWDHVAEWYDQLIGDRKSDHHENVIFPGALRLLHPEESMRVLDVGCGQGEMCRRLADLGARVVGVDASPRLIASAKASVGQTNAGDDEESGTEGAEDGSDGSASFVVGDARKLTQIAELDGRQFDAALSIMALMNIDPIEPVLTGIASLVRPGGALVLVILHPAFRAPGQTSWGWEGGEGGSNTGRSLTDEEREMRAGGPVGVRGVRGAGPAVRVVGEAKRGDRRRGQESRQRGSGSIAAWMGTSRRGRCR